MDGIYTFSIADFSHTLGFQHAGSTLKFISNQPDSFSAFIFSISPSAPPLSLVHRNKNTSLTGITQQSTLRLLSPPLSIFCRQKLGYFWGELFASRENLFFAGTLLFVGFYYFFLVELEIGGARGEVWGGRREKRGRDEVPAAA